MASYCLSSLYAITTNKKWKKKSPNFQKWEKEYRERTEYSCYFSWKDCLDETGRLLLKLQLLKIGIGQYWEQKKYSHLLPSHFWLLHHILTGLERRISTAKHKQELQNWLESILCIITSSGKGSIIRSLHHFYTPSKKSTGAAASL